MAAPVRGVAGSYAEMFQPVLLAQVEGQTATDILDRVKKFDLHEDNKLATEIRLDIHGLGPELDFVDVLEDPRLQPGANWAFRWGYFDALSEKVSALVTHFEPKFLPNGSISVVLHLHAQSTRLGRDTKSQNWGRVDTSTIAKRLAAKYRLKAQVTSSGDRRRKAWIQPAKVTDIAYLQMLARRIGYVVYVEGRTLVYQPERDAAAPVMSLAWYGAGDHEILQAFSPKVKALPRRRTKAGSGVGTADAADAKGTMGKVVAVDATHRSHYVAAGVAGHEQTTERDTKNRKKILDTKQKRLLERANTATADCLGTAGLRRGQVVNIQNVGRQLSGNWKIKGSRHVISNEVYKTTLELKRAANQSGKVKAAAVDTEQTKGNTLVAVDSTHRSHYLVGE